MKYWEYVFEENLTYEDASKNENDYFTRPEWKGIHFHIKGVYYILLGNGKLLKNPSYIESKDKHDWIKVSIKVETWQLIRNLLENNGVYCDFCVNIADGMPKIGSGEETLFHDEKGFSIYNEQFRYEYSVLENVKFCPYCGRRLEEEER